MIKKETSGHVPNSNDITLSKEYFDEFQSALGKKFEDNPGNEDQHETDSSEASSTVINPNESPLNFTDSETNDPSDESIKEYPHATAEAELIQDKLSEEKITFTSSETAVNEEGISETLMSNIMQANLVNETEQQNENEPLLDGHLHEISQIENNGANNDFDEREKVSENQEETKTQVDNEGFEEHKGSEDPESPEQSKNPGDSGMTDIEDKLFGKGVAESSKESIIDEIGKPTKLESAKQRPAIKKDVGKSDLSDATNFFYRAYGGEQKSFSFGDCFHGKRRNKETMQEIFSKINTA